MKRKPLLKVYNLGELLRQTPRPTGIRITKSRNALTLRWGAWKHAPYDIGLNELKTERDILKWTLHLAEKSWVSREQLEDFICAATVAAGIDLHSENAPSQTTISEKP